MFAVCLSLSLFFYFSIFLELFDRMDCVSVIWNGKSRLGDSGNHKVCVISNPNKFCTCYDEMHGDDHGGELCLQFLFFFFVLFIWYPDCVCV